MVKYVASTAQLDLFDTHVSVLRGNSVLASRFKVNDFYEFEPHQKSSSFNGFPYFILPIPELNEEKLDLKRRLLAKDISHEIKMHIEFSSRSKVREYANAVISQIESSIDTYRDAGFDEASIKFIDAIPVIIHQKDLIEVTFMFDCDITVSTV